MQLIGAGSRRLTETSPGGRGVPFHSSRCRGFPASATPSQPHRRQHHGIPCPSTTAQASNPSSLQRKSKISPLVQRLYPQEEQTCGKTSCQKDVPCGSCRGSVGCPGAPATAHSSPASTNQKHFFKKGADLESLTPAASCATLLPTDFLEALRRSLCLK